MALGIHCGSITTGNGSSSILFVDVFVDVE
jgi:hypothetical protein